MSDGAPTLTVWECPLCGDYAVRRQEAEVCWETGDGRPVTPIEHRLVPEAALTEARAETERLKTVLMFYAESPWPAVDADDGERARAALARSSSGANR